MTLTIMHLYYDLLNLYGESGNVKALKNCLEQMGIDVKIVFTTIDDQISLDDVDLIYIGSGTEENQKLIINHLNKYKKEIKKHIENNGYIISTGNSIELFGSQIKKESEIYKTLGIFDYESKIEKFRLVDEALFKCNLIDDYILGFTNRNSVANINDNSLFNVIKGIGCCPNSLQEGYHFKNFYGTYLIGPLLVRNPNLLKFICTEMILNKNKNFKIKDVELKLENNAYQEFMKNYYKEYIK